jgi:transcriptional regulator with XRE-family HTH domain
MLCNMTTQQAPATFNQRVGKNIQRLRKAAEMSQEELGHRLALYGFPMKQQTILMIEGGRRPLKAEELYVIAKVLQVDPGTLTAHTERRAALLEQLRSTETIIARLDRERRGHQQEVDRLSREIDRLDQQRHKVAKKLIAIFTAEEREDLADFYRNLTPAEELIDQWASHGER